MDKLYTIIEVATKLNLSDKTLRRWEEAGKFKPSRTLGNQRRYSLEDLQILDAIKHGTINEQSELLNVEAAAKLCGVSVATLSRWENEGKIHPFITSQSTYYPRHRLMEKLDALKSANVVEEIQDLPPQPTPHIPSTTKLTPLTDTAIAHTQVLHPTYFNKAGIKPYLIQVMITLFLILSYHFLVNTRPSTPLSPRSGSVQGVATTSDPTLDLLHNILDPSGALTTTTITSRSGINSPSFSLIPSSAPAGPTAGTLYYDATSQSLKVYKNSGWSDLAPTTTLKVGEATLITGQSILHKGKNQISVSQEKVTPTTPITLTFTTDYAPAKKYWVTAGTGEFTVSTDFPVGNDAPFNYAYLESNVATASAKPL